MTTKEIQNLIAREVCLTNELQNRSKELIASVSASARLHFNDLAIFSNPKASEAEEELEIAHEQIKDLKRSPEPIFRTGKVMSDCCTVKAKIDATE